MSDSKLNKKILGAVRTGSQRTDKTAGSTWKKMHAWQKIGLILCAVFWIASVILGAVMNRITGSLIDQGAAQRWASNENYAQVSAFLAEGSGASEDTVKAMYTGLMLDLQSDAIALSETQIANGASLLEECYCGMGSADISSSTDSVTVNVIGVGGNFFNFHPLDLLDGYYFSDDDLMQDRVLLDDQTAWRLFGSPNVVGMQVMIAGTPHYIAGVFRQPTERFYKDSGMGNYLVFMSYDSLCKYTESSAASDEDGGTTDDSMDDMSMEMDAFGPRTDPQTVPQTAAYMPELTDDFSDRRAVETEEDFGDFDDSGDIGESEETVTEKVDDSESEEELSDDPVGGNLNTGSESGSGSGKDSGGEEDEEKEEVNRSRVTCFEVVMPNPVSGYALRKVRSRLEQVPFPLEKAAIVDNTSRYDTLRLVSLMGQPGVRSMQIAPIRYPYWENVALAWEDVMIPYALLWMILRYSPLAFLLWLLIWYATHKSWTVGGVIRDVQDKMYDRQSERIYGKRSDGEIPVGSRPALAVEDPPGEEGASDAEKAQESLPADAETEEEGLTDDAESAQEAEESLPDDAETEEEDLTDHAESGGEDLPSDEDKKNSKPSL